MPRKSKELTSEEKQTIKEGLENHLPYTQIGKKLNVSGPTVRRHAQKMVQSGELSHNLLRHVGEDTRVIHRWTSRSSWREKRGAHMEGVRRAIETREERRAAKKFPENELPDATQRGLDSLFAPRRKPQK